MSDEVAKQFASQQPEQTPTPQKRSVTLSITLQPDGSIEFQMPANNKILSYGLLECARAQLDRLYLLDETKKAQQSRGGINGLMKRMNGG